MKSILSMVVAFLAVCFTGLALAGATMNNNIAATSAYEANQAQQTDSSTEQQAKTESLMDLPEPIIDIGAQVPDVLKQGFLLEYWQWIGLLLVIIGGALADKLVSWLFRINITRWQEKKSELCAVR
jgi:MscS family membrane protein